MSGIRDNKPVVPADEQPADKAKRLLIGYFEMAGVPIRPETDKEIRQIVNAIITASVRIAVKQIDKRKVGGNQ